MPPARENRVDSAPLKGRSSVQSSVPLLTRADLHGPATIAIPTHNEVAEIERCFAALAMQCDEAGAPVPHPVTVAANNSRPASAAPAAPASGHPSASFGGTKFGYRGFSTHIVRAGLEGGAGRGRSRT